MNTILTKEETARTLQNMGIERYQIFVSLSSKDKELALPLLSMMDSRNMNYWCMYHANGDQQNIIGSNYKSIISANIKKSCLFVFLFSKASIQSVEVIEELEKAAATIRAGNIFRFLPISLDDIKEDELPEQIINTGLFTKGIIYRQLSKDAANQYSQIMTEIRTQYYDTVMESIRAGHQAMKQSSVFTDLLTECIHRKCFARSVSQDIKAGDEGSSENLLETHVLTDEIIEYDQHPYSCMLISRNLLGNKDPVTGKYDPAKRGVKYFYYCSESYLEEVGEAFRQKMRDYIVKNRISRGEVVLLIRREFSERNKILYFINSFNRLTKDDLLNKYNIIEPEDKALFLSEMDKDENDYYFSYTELPEDCLRVPDTFYVWLSEDHGQLYNDSVREEAYDFIEFLNRLANAVEKIQSESPARDELLKRLQKYCRYLNQLVAFERWQMSDTGAQLSNVTAKKLSNHLIGFTEGSSAYSEEFSNLSDWMRFGHGLSGTQTELDDETINAAQNNLILIPIKENSTVKPCYSFVVFVNKHYKHASWYSTGYEYHDRNMVISYEANPENGECKAFVDAFRELINSDPEIAARLKENKSKLLESKSKSL